MLTNPQKYAAELVALNGGDLRQTLLSIADCMREYPQVPNSFWFAVIASIDMDKARKDYETA